MDCLPPTYLRYRGPPSRETSCPRLPRCFLSWMRRRARRSSPRKALPSSCCLFFAQHVLIDSPRKSLFLSLFLFLFSSLQPPYFALLTTSQHIAITSQTYSTFIGRPFFLEILDRALLFLSLPLPLSTESSLLSVSLALCLTLYFGDYLLRAAIVLLVSTSLSSLRTICSTHTHKHARVPHYACRHLDRPLCLVVVHQHLRKDTADWFVVLALFTHLLIAYAHT